ncbi:UNVERIFIED_CONTAM: hypothetical protein Sindi_1981900 [Sesamum indicum]
MWYAPSSIEAPTWPWGVPPPPAPPLPPVSQRHYISLREARLDQDFNTAIHATVKEHYPHPWGNISHIPQEHQLFWFQNLKLSYLWNCDDELIFNVVNSQEGKFLWKHSPTPETSHQFTGDLALASGEFGESRIPDTVGEE